MSGVTATTTRSALTHSIRDIHMRCRHASLPTSCSLRDAVPQSFAPSRNPHGLLEASSSCRVRSPQKNAASTLCIPSLRPIGYSNDQCFTHGTSSSGTLIDARLTEIHGQALHGHRHVLRCVPEQRRSLLHSAAIRFDSADHVGCGSTRERSSPFEPVRRGAATCVP
ncbi:hypothetical protein DM02DRAFT_285057 [Periconia macrospinosa]|uniref:Uncharacterized protein n=1 Tax=Periconia macrospinosa TaxID=97972 RepID=A0A2V1EC38_9PLEO|nr:hypothetical protein DM02DRAFT_285057 [Periconia macrospinosa]